MKSVTFCWCMSVIPMVLCVHGGGHDHLGNQSTIFVNCNNGKDTINCGTSPNSSCKTLQFVISKRVPQLTTSHVVINISSGDCNENGVLRLDKTKTKVNYWSFVGSNQTSRSPTVVNFSMESFHLMITFSYLTWRNSNDLTSFNIHMSEITFCHCSLQDMAFQFIGLNTNLIIQNTVVTSCTSQSQDIPLFFMQALYNYDTSIFMKNATFSSNTSPIIYAMQLQEIFMEDALFYKNGQHNSSLVTISASSVVLKNSMFNNTLGTAIEVKDVKNFTARKLVFYSNRGKCLLVKRHSNVNMVDSTFQLNINPVALVKDNDGVNILLKACHFGCIQHAEETNLPFLNAPDGSNITATNCTVAKSCSVHCKNGELVKFNLYCQKCQPGRFSHSDDNIILSNSCQSCPAGSYASETGSANCTLCAEGTYVKKTGSEQCKKCTNDFFTSYTGAKSCSKTTLELDLILAATIPLIIIPLVLLFGRLLQKRSLKLKARCRRKYDRFHSQRSVTINATGKDLLPIQDTPEPEVY